MTKKQKELSAYEQIIKDIGEKYEPYFRLIDLKMTELIAEIYVYDKNHDPKINEKFDEFRLWNDARRDASCFMAYEIAVESAWSRSGSNSPPIPEKSTLIPAYCWHCGKMFLTRVRISKKNINDVYYSDANPEHKIKGKQYCSRHCSNQAFYMRKHNIKKEPLGSRVCSVCKQPLPFDASLKRKTCSDNCRKKKERMSKDSL